uniref:Transmembrane protein 79 n=1 Tax=Gadus morhua TaxID=8049 RepID=A0A8C4ZPV1_GADMO
MSAIDRVSEEETAWSQSSRQAEGNLKRRSKWRESMPEGERWRAYESEGQHGDKGSGSLADGEEEEEDDGSVNWMPEKAALVFTPRVNILNNQGEGEGAPAENTHLILLHHETPSLFTDCGSCCSEKLQLCLAMVAALVLFPLLVWGGYALLPFDAPVLKSTPLRLVYTLRCAFFATVPIILGVVVQGAARLRFGELKPLYEGTLESREVAAHGHYVNDSLSLYLFYFLQLAVMATYLNQDHLKLVPLLTIIFAIGRLIYWACLSLGSSVRALGFGFSFFPILVMLGVNLYYIFSSVGQGAVFDVEPPATEAAPMQRWWG